MEGRIVRPEHDLMWGMEFSTFSYVIKINPQNQLWSLLWINVECTIQQQDHTYLSIIKWFIEIELLMKKVNLYTDGLSPQIFTWLHPISVLNIPGLMHMVVEKFGHREYESVQGMTWGHEYIFAKSDGCHGKLQVLVQTPFFTYLGRHTSMEFTRNVLFASLW